MSRAIPKAIIERAQHPLYGYFTPSDEYYNSIIAWRSARGYTDLDRQYIGLRKRACTAL